MSEVNSVAEDLKLIIKEYFRLIKKENLTTFLPSKGVGRVSNSQREALKKFSELFSSKKALFVTKSVQKPVFFRLYHKSKNIR